MPNAKPIKLAGLLVPFFLAACLIIGYWVYWSNAAKQIESYVRAGLPPSAASSVDVSGFPYRLTLRIENLALNAGGGVAFQAKSVVATATPFNPMLWVLEGAYEPALSLNDGPLRPLKATALKASLRVNQRGLERFSLTFDGLEAETPNGPDLSNWSAGRGLLHLVGDSKDVSTLAFVTEVNAIKLAQPLAGPGAILGQTINRFRIAGPIADGQTLLTSGKAWRQKGGKLTIMAGELSWGPVSLSEATGTLSLSASNRLDGRIDGKGALKPEGIAVAGLSGPIGVAISDGQLSLAGLGGIDLAQPFR